MTAEQLIKALQAVPADTTIELPDGSSIDNLCFHGGMKRLSVGTEDDKVETLADGWYYLVF